MYLPYISQYFLCKYIVSTLKGSVTKRFLVIDYYGYISGGVGELFQSQTDRQRRFQ